MRASVAVSSETPEYGTYLWRQTYEIVEGDHSGIKGAARFALTGTTHKPDEIVTGLFDPETGVIESQKGISRLMFLATQGTLISLICFAVAAYIIYG